MRRLTRLTRFALVAACVATLTACTPQGKAPTAAEASAFVAQLNQEMAALGKESMTAGWVQSTYITADTQWLSARANERALAHYSRAVREARRFDGIQMDAASARAISLLTLSDVVSAPAPDDAARRSELTTLMAKLDAAYGEGKYCVTRSGREECRNIDQLSETMARSRDFDALTEAWAGWHGVGRQMRDDYTRFVELANEGARELGFTDLGAMWRSRYDMTPQQFEAEVERLWQQVAPLYEALHCYARTQLAKKYGEDRVPAGKPIPAQLLGNLWAQQWNNIYDDILNPYPGVAQPNLDAALVKQKYTAERMTRQAESFYRSLGMPALPATFWQRSMFTRPRDREVDCHASASHIDGRDDVRIKQCMTQTEEELDAVYHELGHVYYFLAYKDQPYMFQNGAHDGFHEAIGDTVLLSMTPGYLAQIGLGPKVAPSREAVINEQMRMAADKIAFLPFGMLVDRWRWQVFSGETAPGNYNKAWWDLRLQYQGVVPPVARSEADFDPGAKSHIPGNTPYARYFLSFIIQFQFHRALCEAAGYKGPLHECSVFGSKQAGQKFQAMLAAGASRPWAETMEKLTGTREMDASAILEYFAPLQDWLREKNAGQKCGWGA